MVKRKIFFDSLQGTGPPTAYTALRKVASLGNMDRSATTGAYNIVFTLRGL